MADDDNTQNLPAIISRADARAAGLKLFFTGKPCKRGHVAERRVGNSDCVECSRECHAARWQRVRPEPKPVSDYKLYNHVAAAAKAAGLTRYFDGKPCRHGHIAERFVGNHGCVACNEMRVNRYVEANRAMINAKQRARDKADPAKKARRMRIYYEKNLEKYKERAKRKRLANIEKYAAYQRNRKARKDAAEGSHTAEDIKRIYQAQKGKCACCRVKVGKKYHVDHIVALSKGGSNFPANLQILCGACNVRKSNKDPIDFMQLQGFLL